MTTEFSRWLRGQMERREWGVTRLARELGINHGTVSLWLSEDRKPSPASLDKIADILGADLDMLLALAGHRAQALDTDPESPEAILCAMVRRIAWDKGRYDIVDGMLRTFLEQDRQARKEADQAEAPSDTSS